MSFYVITNSNQETQIEALNSLHIKSFNGKDDFHNLLVQFVQEHKNDEKRPYFFEKASNAIRHIIYSFKKYQTEPNDSEYEEIMERDYAMMLNFFMNAHAFIHLIKNSTHKNIIKPDDSLPKGIKFFRDCFAHQYEKELIKGGDKYYIPHIRQRAMAMLDILEMRDPDSGVIVYEVNFSLSCFYVGLKDVFKNFIKANKSK